MKKSRLLLAATVISSLFLASGCSWFDKDASAPVDTNIEGKPMSKTVSPFSDEYKKTDVYDKPVAFSGAATRTDYFCSGGSCDTCENPGTLTITLNPDGTAKLSHVGQCLGYGIKGCSASEGNCEYNADGGYSKNNDNITFNKCDNKKFAGSGSSKILGDTTTGSIRCEDKGEPMMIMEWNALPKVQ